MNTRADLDVRLEYFDGCPSWRLTEEYLRAVLDEMGLAAVVIRHELIATIEEAQAHRFTGSPTIRINGVDPFANSDDEPALACRVYVTPDGLAGSPTIDQLRAGLAQLT